FVSGTLSVTPAPLEIDADSKTMVLGDALPSLTASMLGLVNGDTASAVHGLALSTMATSTSGVGAYPITASGASSADYAISCAGGTLPIVSTPQTPTTLSVGSSSGTYGGTATLTATLTAAGQPLGGESVDFVLGTVDLGTVATNGSGVAILKGVSL